MTTFDFWQRWGIDLDDTQFANAWAALGVAQPHMLQNPDRLAALDAARVKPGTRARLPWAFPLEQTARDSGTPEQWAAAWSVVGNEVPRLAVVQFPQTEPVLPWFRLLHEAKPGPGSVSFSLPPRVRAPVEVSWPLRFGFIPGNDGEGVIDTVRENWPANSLTRKIALGRDDANCDVLIYRGAPRVLLAELLALVAVIKTHFVLLIDAGSEDYSADKSRLDAAMNELHASGHALLRAPMSGDDLAAGINQFVVEVSHSMPFDLAIETSLGARRFDTKLARLDTFAAYTDPLASFQLADLAERLSRRAQAMPAGAEIDLSGLGSRDVWPTRGVRINPKVIRERRAPAAPPPPPPPPPAPPPSMAAPAPMASPPGGGQGTGRGEAGPRAVPRMAARELEIDAAALPFDHEGDGASTLATVSDAVEAAEVTAEEHQQRAARFLQQRSSVRRGGEFQDATHGFIAGKPALVRVRIGPPEGEWNSLASAFPVAALPQHLEQWTLTVWLTEPDHLREPLSDTIKLPRDGASTEAEFNFKPQGSGPSFEARLTVLHRGRVIQTAVLRASVQADAETLQPGSAPTLAELIPVRQAIGELKHRQKFDLAFVINHNAAGRPLSVGLADKHAWVSDLSQSKAIAEDISARLAPIAKSAADFADGLRGEKGRALLVQLAQAGSLLNEFLVNQQINASGNRPELAKAEYLQVVSTRLDAVIPFEFIFDYAAPEDDAKLCPNWRKGVEKGACAKTCDRTSGKHVCPMGFWGLQKVIERHAINQDLAKTGRELFLQSETSAARPALELGGVSVFGASDRVKAPALKALAKTIKKAAGKDAEQARDWDQWMECVKRARPKLLLALAHTDGRGMTASLEIGGKALKSVLLRDTHIRGVAQDPPPLVALLGCDVVGTADDYGNHAAMFRSRGAAVVIATIATVLGDHAAKVGESLVTGLMSGQANAPQRVGEALRAIKRQALLDDQLMPLCLIAYGDADWQIKT